MLAQAPVQDRVLAVDLDGTLIRTDMLYETFWSAFSRNWTTPVVALGSLAGGRAALKARLAGMADVDVQALPYNETIIAHVREWRAAGGRTALVTASDREVAERVAAHLGIFDEVHGSDGATNLKGPRKAEFLVERFGEGGFAYIGDATADLAVWRRAGEAITATPSKSLRAKVDGLGPPTRHLVDDRGTFKAYAKALRPHQWLKNALVFLPMLAAHQLSPLTILQAITAFVVFSMVASSVYLLNDLLDLSADRNHPRKRRRPFAAGLIPLSHGTILAPLLLLAGFLLALPLGPKFVLVMLAYYATTMAYSLHLKRRIIIDICVLAGLYTLRVLAGGMATDVPLSVWLLAFSIFFFFSLAAVKRQAELADAVDSNKLSASGRGYRADDLQLITSMAIASGYVSVLVMALYTTSSNVTALYHHAYPLWGVCLVLFYWISRMVMITHRRRMHDDPVVFAVKDRVSHYCLLIIAALVGASLLP